MLLGAAADPVHHRDLCSAPGQHVFTQPVRSPGRRHHAETIAALGEWDGTGLPSGQVYALAARELEQARARKTIGKLATRLNRDASGLRSVIMRTGRGLQGKGKSPWSESLPDIHPAWGEPEIWQTLVRTGARVTPVYYLNAVDLTLAGDGGIARQPGATPHLHGPVHQDHPGQPDHHPAVPVDRLPGRLSRCPLTTPAGPPVAGAGAGAVLDLATGAHHVLDRAVTTTRRTQRHPGLARTGCRRSKTDPGPQYDRYTGSHDACAAALHDPAALFRYERDPRGTDASRRVTGGQLAPGPSARSTCHSPCRASAPVACWYSSLPSATTSPRHWWVGRAAS